MVCCLLVCRPRARRLAQCRQSRRLACRRRASLKLWLRCRQSSLHAAQGCHAAGGGARLVHCVPTAAGSLRSAAMAAASSTESDRAVTSTVLATSLSGRGAARESLRRTEMDEGQIAVAVVSQSIIRVQR